MTKTKQVKETSEAVQSNKPTAEQVKLDKLNSIGQKEYNEMPIDEKREVLELVIFANNYYKERADRFKSEKKELQSRSKVLTGYVKEFAEITKDLANKFGKIDNPTKKDFVVNQYLNWNQPQNVISRAVDIWNFCAQSTLVTINAIQGSKDSNKKFLEFAKDWSLIEAPSSKGKVYKIDLDALSKEQQEAINYFSIEDFKAEAKRQSLRVTAKETEASSEEVEEVDASEFVDIDF